jgi:hypothetical protein
MQRGWVVLSHMEEEREQQDEAVGGILSDELTDWLSFSSKPGRVFGAYRAHCFPSVVVVGASRNPHMYGWAPASQAGW